MKEVKVLHTENIPSPYKGWVMERNGKIGTIVSKMQGGADVTVATRPVTADEVPKDSSFYGTVVGNHTDVEKTVFHPVVHDADGASFQYKITEEGLVLPGVTVTTKEEFMEGILKLRKQAGKKVKIRAKLPSESDGNGQYEFARKRKGMKIAKQLESIIGNGVVLETQIKNPKTISVGFAVIGDETYSFIAQQKDEIVKEKDAHTGKKTKRNRYQGATVTVVKGEIESLSQLDNLTEEMRRAIAVSKQFYDGYKQAYEIDAKRISFDYMYGNIQKRNRGKGERVGGITDITARPGGTDPALLIAAKELQHCTELTSVSAEVVLDYKRKQELPKGAEVFVDDRQLRIYAMITNRSGNIFSNREREVAA